MVCHHSKLKIGNITDVKLAYAEFASNRSPTYSTKCSPFEDVYSANPRVPIDLIPFPNDEVYHVDAKEKAQAMLKLHAQVKARIDKVTGSTNK